MKKAAVLLFGFLLAISLTLSAQTVIENVSFDNYISPTNNDLQNHFYGSGFGMSLSAIPANGITGGCLLTNDTNIWGNDNATYCSKFKGNIGSTYVINICFKYDSAAVNPAYFERPVSIWFNPSADWNHYLIATISHTRKFEQITYGWINPSAPTLSFQNNYWYKFSLSATFTGGVSGDQIDIVSNAYNLGLNGTGSPVLIGNRSGTFNDSILIADTAISVSINGAHWGGAIYLDDFYFQGIKSPDSCLTVTAINETTMDDSDFTYRIENNILYVSGKNDFKNNEIEILNVGGQKLLVSNLTSATNEFNISEFKNGLYFLYFRSPKRIYTTKFIVMK